ncbi:MAG: hypothetical protein M3Z26_05825 [Bacteroidota bacterium]|nr:hypothetical protein [Bacteroidota bacterium]
MLQKRSRFKVILSMGLMALSLNGLAQDSTKTKSDFKPSGKIWGLAFGDYAYKFHADSAQRGSVQYSKLAKDYNSFNIRRIYFGYDYQFTPNISSQLLLAHESGFEASTTNPDVLPDNNRTFYIKAINIRFKNVIPRATIVAGQQSTPTFATLTEGVWGYRSIEKTITDMRGISSSTDLGVGVYGKIGKSENVGYDVLIGNSNGAKIENNNFKKIYTSLYAYFFNKKLVIQGNFEHDQTTSQPVRKTITNLKAFAAYKTSTTTIGVEAFKQFQSNNTSIIQGNPPTLDTLYSDVKPSGISFYLTQQLTKDKLNFFARFDIYNPDSKYNTGNSYIKGYNTTKEQFATIGLDFIPSKNIHIMPNLWYNGYHSKLSGASGNLKNDYDLEGRLTLYFTINR